MSLKSILSSLISHRTRTDITPEEAFGSDKSWSGIRVTKDIALGLPIVWACTRVLSETLASMPLIMYQKNDQGRIRAQDHPLYDLLHIKPNHYQTAFQFKEQLQGHLCIDGNAYAQKLKKGTSYIKELIPLNPYKMKIEWTPAGILYKYTTDNGEETLTRDEVFHVAGFGFDGVRGYSPIEVGEETLGLAIAAKRYAAEFYKNNGTPDFIIKHPNKLSTVAHDRLRQSWKEQHAAWGKKHSLFVLEEGMDTKETQLQQDKAQFLETQKFLTIEVCRMYRIQPHIVQDLERSTNNNIEHQGLEFVTYTMHPWCVRWEQAATLQLMTDSERREYFYEFLVDALLRGDIKSRAEAYKSFIEMGVLNPNEVREKENWNKREGGDIYQEPAPSNLLSRSQIVRDEKGNILGATHYGKGVNPGQAGL